MHINSKLILAALFICGGLFTILPTAVTAENTSATAGRAINRASDIMSREVVNDKGQHLGFSKDLIIGKDGCIAYLVMLRGSAFGIIGPLLPVPWSMVTLQEYEKPLVIKVDPEVINKAPGFTLGVWPDFFSPDEQEKIEQYYRSHLEK